MSSLFDLTEILLYNRGMDKRILRTDNRIKTALMQLSLENELENITVSEVAERAKINRSTFYLHYRDISSVIEDIEREFAEEISARISDFDLNDIYGSIYGTFYYLTSALDNNELKKRYIIFSSDTGNVTKRLKSILAEKTLNAILSAYPDYKAEDIIYPLTFAAAGIVESYVKWERADGDKKPFEELLRELSDFTDYIIKSITTE